MKKSIVIVVIIVVLGLIIWGVSMNKGGSSNGYSMTGEATSTQSAVVDETTKVSDKLSQYSNEELGFSVNYPSSWEADKSDTGVTFIIPAGTTDTNTLGKLQASITIASGKCAFPPVTTIQSRGTVATTGGLSLNTIAISNSVQGREYFDRLYSLQNGQVCYVFGFSSITLSPASKGLKGSAATQMTNNDKAIVDAADQQFASVVKSFAYVVTDPGKLETSVVPTAAPAAK